MNHIPRFKVLTLQDGKGSVVGDCNGYGTEDRFALETPIFAESINSHITSEDKVILDYGCGMGRLAKQILKINKNVRIIGIDASPDERRLAKDYVNNDRFTAIEPEELNEKVDMVYCIYVLQHVPAIELRHALERMHYFLKPNGKFIYCSSDHRMAIAHNNKFADDQILGVFPRIEISRLFWNIADLFDLSKQPKIIKDIVTAEGLPKPPCVAHPALVYRRKDIPEGMPYFNVRFDKL